MKCKKCGNEVVQGQAFCSKCGAPVREVKSQIVGEQSGFDNQSQRKGGVPVWVFILTILAVVAIMLGIMFFMLNNKHNEVSAENNSSNSSINSDESNGNNNTANTNTLNNNQNNTNTISNSSKVTSYYNVTVGEYTVKVPDNLIYDSDGKTLLIVPEDQSWGCQLAIQNQPYTTISSNINKVSEYIKSMGYIVKKAEEKTVNGINCCIFETSLNGKNELIAYVRVNAMSTAVVDVVSDDFIKYNYDALGEAVKIVASAKNVSTTKPNTTNLNSNDVTSLFYKDEQ